MNWLPFIISGLGVGGVYALAGVGLVLLYRTTGVLNFSFGAVGAFGAFTTFSLLPSGIGLLPSCLAGIAVSVVISCFYGQLLAPKLAYRDTVVRSVGTLGFALVLLGLMGLIWGEIPRRIQFPTDRMYLTIFDARLTYTRLIALCSAALIVVSLSIFISRSRMGLNMRALANNRDLSAILGIRVRKTEFISWLIIGVFAGISGLLFANLVGLKAYSLTFLVIPAIASALLGGMQSLPWTAVSGLLIGVLEALLSAFPAIAPFRSASPFIIALLAVTAMAFWPMLNKRTS